MANNTYTQLHIQAVFAVKNRQSLIKKEWKDEFYQYITGIIQSYGHKVLQINGVSDHIHILIGLRPNQSISELMKNAKQDSSAWINKKGLIKSRFSWQSGYGAFSYSKSHVTNVINYIKNQEEHHRKKILSDEYLQLLNEFQIDYDERYILKSVT